MGKEKTHLLFGGYNERDEKVANLVEALSLAEEQMSELERMLDKDSEFKYALTKVRKALAEVRR